MNEHVINQSATGMAFDFGVQYLTDWRGLKLGMVMKNFGPSMTLRRPGHGDQPAAGRPGPVRPAAHLHARSRRASSCPRSSRWRGACDVYSQTAYKITALGALQNNNFQGNALRAGLEWTYRDQIALRASYYGSFRGDDGHRRPGRTTRSSWAATTSTPASGLGGGFNIRTGDTGKLGVDFCWRPVRDGLFDDIFDLGLKLAF